MFDISVIVPIYNSEKYLKKCVDSIINQSHSNIEIILVDDGSLDNSLSICKNYAKNDKRIKLISKKNGGVSSARNEGIKNANGKYILFVDSDDYIKVDTIEILLKFQKQYDRDILIFNQKLKNRIRQKQEIAFDSNKKNEIMKEINELLYKGKLNPPWDKLYKNQIIKENNILFDESISLGEDSLFNYNYFSYIKSMAIITDQLYIYNYGINENSLSLRKWNNKYEIVKKLDENLSEIIKKSENFSLCYESKENVRIKNILSCFLDMYDMKNDFKRQEKKAYISQIVKKEDSFEIDIIKKMSYKILANMINNNKVSLFYIYILSLLRKLKRKVMSRKNESN